MTISKQLAKQLNTTLEAHQLKMMEISGVDVKRLHEQQAETAAKMAEFAEKIGASFRGAALDVAELHRTSVLSYYKYRASPFRWMVCIEPRLDKALDCDKSIELWPPEDNLYAKGDAVPDLAENICRPYLELKGKGVGNPVSGTVKCGLVFSQQGIKVEEDDRYRIRAFTQANGYRLLQLWGACTPGPATTGHLKITVRLCVAQLFDESWSEPIVLVDTMSGGPPAAIHLNRHIDHWTDLRAGSDVDIKVEFMIDAGIDGTGQCFVDLQTSNFFYFKVPDVTICRSLLKVVEVGPSRRFEWLPREHRRHIPAQAVLELLEKYGIDIGPPELL